VGGRRRRHRAVGWHDAAAPRPGARPRGRRQATGGGAACAAVAWRALGGAATAAARARRVAAPRLAVEGPRGTRPRGAAGDDWQAPTLAEERNRGGLLRASLAERHRTIAISSFSLQQRRACLSVNSFGRSVSAVASPLSMNHAA